MRYHKRMTVVVAVLFCLLTSLGFWQLKRGHEKKILQKKFLERTQQAHFSVSSLNKKSDWRFYRVKFHGYFDTTHILLLDNKIFQGKVGYEVYAPFHAEGLKPSLLVDLGFVPMGSDRAHLPLIHLNGALCDIAGMMNVLPLYHALGTMIENQIRWPLRVEYLNWQQLMPVLKTSFYPYVLEIESNDPHAFQVSWHASTMSFERHYGYAVQWFALALTLLILFVALNRASYFGAAKTTEMRDLS